MSENYMFFLGNVPILLEQRFCRIRVSNYVKCAIHLYPR